MRTILTRAAALAAALLVALPVAAGADVTEHAAEANTSAVKLSVFEDNDQVPGPLLDLISTDALSSSDPMASASVDAIEVLGTTIGEVRTATSERERDRDPESGDGCVAAVGTTGLTLDVICAVASARAGNPGDTGNQDATASTTLTDVKVNGSFVAAALTTPLDEFIDSIIDDLADGAVAAAVDAFRAECNTLLTSVPDPLNEIPNTVAELIGEAEAATGAELDALRMLIGGLGAENPCTAILSLTVGDVTAPAFDVKPVADALADVDLLTLALDGARSEIAGTDTSIGADAEQVFVSIDGPPLAFLDDVLRGIVQGIYDGLLAQLETIAGQDMPEDFDFNDEIAAALDQIPLFGIDDPLLTVVASGGLANADLKLDDGTSSGGGEEPYVTLSIAPGVVELLGGDPEMASLNLAAGESQTIAADTPLESTISVGTLTVDDDATFEDTDLTGTRSTASVTTVDLLTGVEGGVSLTLAASSAGVFGTTEQDTTVSGSDPDANNPLPHTGGGAAAIAALALGGAVLLRRRRD